MSDFNKKDITWADAIKSLPKRDPAGHKGTFGKVLVVGGSHGVAGAAYFCAKAALLMGCGMVRIATHECNRVILQVKLPEALISTYEDRHFEETIFDAIRWADTVVIGPGLSQDSLQKDVFKYAFEKTCEMGLPMVIDADGLNILSRDMSLLEGEHPDIILTPHLGEMSGLTGKTVDEIAADMASAAKSLADSYRVFVHLKSAASVTAKYGDDEIIQYVRRWIPNFIRERFGAVLADHAYIVKEAEDDMKETVEELYELWLETRGESDEDEA